MPYVLAETLNGLDAISSDGSDFFHDSSILQYVWLLECFWFVSDRHVGPAILQNPASFSVILCCLVVLEVLMIGPRSLLRLPNSLGDMCHDGGYGWWFCLLGVSIMCRYGVYALLLIMSPQGCCDNSMFPWWTCLPLETSGLTLFFLIPDSLLGFWLCGGSVLLGILVVLSLGFPIP